HPRHLTVLMFWLVCFRPPSASSIDPPPATKSPCPSDYISWYQNCYKLVEEAASWEAAQAACRQQDRGDLVSVDSSYEQAFLSGVVLKGKHEAWMGLRRQGDGSYKWSDGWPVFFTQWGPGEPSNLQDEGCVVGYNFGQWNDEHCNVSRKFICKHANRESASRHVTGVEASSHQS
uniref:C-type lectin domain-containing protein n=1 Tax=Salarias fasciatus TaxID=181472 RepID=A0A672JBB3_SALFA